MLPAWCLNLTFLSFCILYFSHISGSEGCSTFRANWDSQVLWWCHAVWRVEPSQASQGRGYLVSFGAEGVYYLTTLGCRPAPSQAPVLLFQWFLVFSAKLFHFHGYLISWSFHSLCPFSKFSIPYPTTLSHWPHAAFYWSQGDMVHLRSNRPLAIPSVCLHLALSSGFPWYKT